MFVRSQKKSVQYLPVSEAASLDGAKIDLEVPKTLDQRELGLSGRPFLPPNRGMLFEFPATRVEGFWMKDMLIPLDIIFIKGNTISYIESNLRPCKVQTGCSIYQHLADKVLEIPANRASQLGIHVGDRIDFFRRYICIIT